MVSLRLFFLAVLASTAVGAKAQDIGLRLPVACQIGSSCFVQHYVDRDPGPKAVDHRCGAMTYNGHDGIDFRLPTMKSQKAGMDVLAAADGVVLRTRDGVRDVSVAIAGKGAVANAECGNGIVLQHADGWETQYCHMAKGSLAVQSGAQVKAGQPIGRIGMSGLTEFPHLHFTVRRNGAVVDPFVKGPSASVCERDGASATYWEPVSAAELAYRPVTLLNKGFAAGPVTMEAIESGDVGGVSVGMDAPALVAFIRSIGLRRGDIQKLALLAPDGAVLAESAVPALDRDKAQWMSFTGVKRPASGWPAGAYRGRYMLTRGGRTIFEETFELDMK
jgi:hypothetical protein